jgi:hypothetical protein
MPDDFAEWPPEEYESPEETEERLPRDYARFVSVPWSKGYNTDFGGAFPADD